MGEIGSGDELAEAQQRASGLWWRWQLANPDASAEVAYKAGLARADADVAAARELTGRAEAALGRIAASYPEVLAGGETIATLAKVSGWIHGATDEAGTAIGRLLTNQQALADAGLVLLAHDLLNELSVLRNASELLKVLLTRVSQVPPTED